MPYRRSQRANTNIAKIPLGLVEVVDLVSKTDLPGFDFAINPYVGCPHACRYCYASFMKDLSGHDEEWGEFVDAKLCDKPLSSARLSGKKIFMSSTCDIYNPKERDVQVTRGILEQLASIDCAVHLNTKSDLVLRDIDILEQMANLTVGISINTLDERFRADMDRASSISRRLTSLKELHDAGIYTICLVSPIFPGITDWRAIVNETRNIANEWWFEDLNLRGTRKYEILSYVATKYPHLESDYYRIYRLYDFEQLEKIEKEIVSFCEEEGLAHLDAFHHPVCPRAGQIINRDEKWMVRGDSLF